MNLKKFIVGGILGGLVDWVLGWLFYGMIFKKNNASFVPIDTILDVPGTDIEIFTYSVSLF